MGLAIDKDQVGDGFDIRSLAVSYRDGFTVDEHDHPWGQLVYAVSGVMRVRIGNTVWFVPPACAIWLPPRCSHAIVMQGEVAMRTLYIAAERALDLAGEPAALTVSPLLRELILHILKIGMLDPRKAEHRRLAGVLTDLIRLAPAGNMRLPMPMDPRAYAAAEWFQANPCEWCDLPSVARRAGGSLRTLQRHFRQQTGITMTAWRQTVRLIHAIGGLSNGASVTEVAINCGYSSTSNFIVAFKNQFGVTPGQY